MSNTEMFFISQMFCLSLSETVSVWVQRAGPLKMLQDTIYVCSSWQASMWEESSQCGGEKTFCRNLVSHSTLCVPGIEFRSQA